MDTSKNTPQNHEELYAFQLQVIHPGTPPYAFHEVWKHPKGMEGKLATYLSDLLVIGIAPAKALAERLLSGKVVVFPGPTREHDTPGVVLVPNADVHVVSQTDLGRL